MVLSTHQKTGGKQTMNNDIRTVNIPLKSEFSYILALLMAYKWSDNDEFFKNKFLKPFIEQLKIGVGA